MATSSTSTVYHVHYEVRSPRGNRWERMAGPFGNLADARTHRDTLLAEAPVEGPGQILSYRITEVRETTTVVDQG